MTDLAHSLPLPFAAAEHAAPRVDTDRFDVLVQRAILRSSGRLRRVLARPDERHRASALDRWFGGFAAEVRGHLELTETHVLPPLAFRGAIDDRELDAIAADHGWIDHLLGELGDAFGVLAFGFGDPVRWWSRAASLADELDLVLAGVISRERRTIAPLATHHLTTGELDDVERQRRRDLVVRRVPFALAWLCDALGDDTEAAVLAAVPGPARLVYRTRRRAYARTARQALG